MPTILPPCLEYQDGSRTTDLIILDDISAGLGNNPTCRSKQNFIAEAVTALKGDESTDNGSIGPNNYKNVRYAYATFDDSGVVEITSLSDDINRAPVTGYDLINAYFAIEGKECGSAVSGGEPDLCSALEYAIGALNDPALATGDAADDAAREKKIIIVSSNEDTQCNDGSSICDSYRDAIYGIGASDGEGIGVIMVNIDFPNAFPIDLYEKCITYNDPDRIIDVPTEDLNEVELRDDLIEKVVKKKLCENEPSPSPTTDPTADPTKDPTIDPTRDPTTDPTIDPTSDPTIDPTTDPTADPTADPTKDPTSDPTKDPTADPTIDPTADPTVDPTADPTRDPTSDPTADPTADPTKDPTADPTADPTRDPTADPTKDPTADPTIDPTRDPTTDPTAYPTESPHMRECEYGHIMDVAFIVDNSCGLSDSDCETRQEGISELISSLKNDDTPRLLYITTEGETYEIVVPLDSAQYNQPPVTAADFQSLMELIRNNDCGSAATSGQPLKDAVNAAVQAFRDDDGADAYKVIIISCSDAGTDADDICDYQSPEKKDMYLMVDNVEVEVTIINTDPGLDDDYLQCLTEGDGDRFFDLDTPSEDAFADIVEDFYKEICEKPTQDPTMDPTTDPTSDPTKDPTKDPTVDPTRDPTADPTIDPTIDPTSDPTSDPTKDPTVDPTADPTVDPTADPTVDPTIDPTVDPTIDPTADPTADPTVDPTVDPTSDPTADPTKDPTIDPTRDPTADPTIDPTSDPTADPTIDPTADPTADPTIDPTADPTIDPTADPTRDPTADPTTDPTTKPTKSPLQPPCEYLGEDLDVIFLVDSSSLPNYPRNECETRQKYIAEFMTGIKGVELDSNNGQPTKVRLAYIEFGSKAGSITKWPDLADSEYNAKDFTAMERAAFANIIEGKDCRKPGNSGTPDLYQAIQAALDEFKANSNDPYDQRDRKIVIFSSGYVNDYEQNRICNEFAEQIRTGVLKPDDPQRGDNIINYQGINVIFANFGRRENDCYVEYGETIPDNYLSCLTEFDDDRIFKLPYCEKNLFEPCNFDSMVYEVCSEPSPSPTVDPTIDPTSDPTADPTIDPTADPTIDPTADPTRDPSPDPTMDPTRDPTADPTKDPTADPTADPTRDPTADPTRDPTSDPTADPTIDPTADPTADPTKDPTADPTADPTRDPTADPTADPTKDPTSDPTKDPTADPTIDPTRDPTTDPTAMPTRSPVYGACDIGFGMDVVFVVDYSCPMTTYECDQYFEGISEFMGSLKDSGSPRFAYLPFSDEADASEFVFGITLDDPKYNDLTQTGGIPALMNSNRYNLSQYIANGGQYGGYDASPCNADTDNDGVPGFDGTDTTNLIDAIGVAITHLNDRNEAPAADHHKKIVIFSRCLNDRNTTYGPSDDFYSEPCDYINLNPRGANKPILVRGNYEVEFVVVNVIGDGEGEIDENNAQEYLVESEEGDECLIEDDIDGRLVVIGRENRTTNSSTLDKFYLHHIQPNIINMNHPQVPYYRN